MARSAREVIDDHVWGGQARLARYRKQTEGSGVYIAPEKYAERDAALLKSLLAAQALLENACYGTNDPRFSDALADWVRLEWGGFLDPATYTVKQRILG